MKVSSLAHELARHVALLVEDETLVAMIAEEYLTALGYLPRWVQTGGEAIAALAEPSPPALAIIDIGLPDMRGDDLARRALEMAPDMSIILATGYDPASLSQGFADAPRVRALGKPYDEHALRAAIAGLGLATTELET